VPYGEPTRPTPAYKSLYYEESHGRLQRAVREWADEMLKPETQLKPEAQQKGFTKRGVRR
jgi:hypothetical protein